MGKPILAEMYTIVCLFVYPHVDYLANCIPKEAGS